MAMSPEAQQLYDSVIENNGTHEQAIAKVLRAYPREMMTALPAPAPGLLRGVAGAAASPRFQPATPRFQPAAPRFTPPPPRFAPGTAATTPPGAPPTPYAAPAAVAPRYPGSPAPSTGGSGMTPAGFASGVGLSGLVALPAAYMTVPDRQGQLTRMNAIDDADRRNDAQLAAILAARGRQDIDDLDRANDVRAAAASRMQAIDDADRLNDARMIAARKMQAIDDRDRLADARAMSSRPTTPGDRAVQQAREVAQRPREEEQSRVSQLFNTIFSGKDYQSSGGNLVYNKDGQNVVNWGSSESPADFFRASAAAQKLREAGKDFTGASGSDIDYQSRMESAGGKAGGGAVESKPSKEAMLHKALEIIHHMIRR